MERVDTIIKNASWLITVDPRRRIIRDGAVAIRGGRIVAVDKTRELESAFVADDVLDARNKVVTPGLIDSHLHSSFQLSRGLADEVGSKRFLFERMYPYEGSLSDDDTYWSALLCCYESLRHGVTCFVDPGNYAPSATVRAVEESGMRAIIAKSCMDVGTSAFGKLPERFLETAEEGLARSLEVVEQHHGAAGDRVRVALSCRGINNCSDAFLKMMSDAAGELKTILQAHACFAIDTRDASLLQHGVTEIERLARLEALSDRLLLIHTGWATPADLALLRSHDVKVVVCASSSLHNGYGNLLMGHAPEQMEDGMRIGMGSDHASSGIVDLVSEMLLVAGGYKEIRLNPAILPPEQIVEMATINGAACGHWEDEIGSLEVGKRADITLFDATKPEWQPLYNPVSNLVYSANGNTVDSVLVDGRLLVAGGQVLSIDYDSVLKQIGDRAESILERTGLRAQATPKWPIS